MFDIGSSLREARLRQRLDFPELEQLTKIRPKYLRALEDEHFEVLPAPTYVRGFLRSYAEALGLDGQPFVDEYNSRFAVGEDEAPVRARRSTLPRVDRSSPRESRMVMLALVGIAVVFALVIAAWRFGGPEPERVPGLNVQGQNRPAETSAAQRAVLVVRATEGSTWMEVRAGAAPGRALYSGTLARGDVKQFVARTLQLSLAKPENVLVRLNGSALSLPAGTAFVVTARRIVPAS